LKITFKPFRLFLVIEITEEIKMKEEDDILRRCGTGNPFKVPEGYLDNLSDRIMNSLPEKGTTARAVAKTEFRVWGNIRPWFYLAAVFVGLVFGINFMFHRSGDSSLKKNQQAKVNIEQLSDQDVETIVANTHLDDYSLYEYLSDAK
jgi:hypothetical protein